MSELINNSTQRKEMLRHLLLRLHEGDNPEVLRQRLIEVLKGIPYNEVVEVEQKLINSNALTEEEILDFCDLHTAVLDGSIDLQGAAPVPAGHPVDTFKKENVALQQEIDSYRRVKEQIGQIINDFKSGKENRAAFWMSSFMKTHFIYIEYSAVRGKEGEYLGVVEVTQDITQLRKLEGDQRLLSYEQK